MHVSHTVGFNTVVIRYIRKQKTHLKQHEGPTFERVCFPQNKSRTGT